MDILVQYLLWYPYLSLAQGAFTIWMLVDASRRSPELLLARAARMDPAHDRAVRMVPRLLAHWPPAMRLTRPLFAAARAHPYGGRQALPARRAGRPQGRGLGREAVDSADPDRGLA